LGEPVRLKWANINLFCVLFMCVRCYYMPVSLTEKARTSVLKKKKRM